MPLRNDETESSMSDQLSKSDTIKLRNKHIGRSCQLFYRSDPLKIVRGLGQYMFDEEGVRYLDCINNVAHVGHCHSKVVQAGCMQMATLSTNNRFLHDELVQCAQKLTSKLPSPLSVCFLVNSGSEANDLALRLARNHTKRKDIITLDHAYHGHLQSVMEVSPYKFNQPGGDKKADFVHVAPCPDVYGGVYNDKDHPHLVSDFGRLYAKFIEDICKELQSRGKGVAAFIAESLQSCGGQIVPPKGYFQNVVDILHKMGGLFIADEVQVGFGRVGSHYWGFEMQGVVPDIVTVAKPMGNGHPVGAVVTTPQIANSFYATGVSYFNTYGGNPVSCAIANAVMKVIDEEHLQENAFKVGGYLLQQCNKLKSEFEWIGDVRGSGLFIGIELVQNKATREAATEAVRWIVNRMKESHKILVSSDGPRNNVIKMKPPMVFNKDNADEFLFAFRECILSWINEKCNSTNGVSLTQANAAAPDAPTTVTTMTTTTTTTSTLCNPPTNQIHKKRDNSIKSV